MDINDVKRTIVDVLKTADVKKASLFGSFISDNYTSLSDIDILIEFNDKQNKSLLDLIELKSLLKEKTQSRIDLVTFDSISPNLKEYILSNNESIYG